MKAVYHQITIISIYSFMSLFLLACGGSANIDLPIYGQRQGLNEQGDTIYHRIGDFSLVNQDSQVISSKNLEGRVYVADFFFINCPSICPAVTGQKLRIYERFEEYPEFIMLSHTVDPKRDSVDALYEFATNIGASSDRWHFLTGEEEYIHELAVKSYLMAAREDKEAPGGFLHQDKLVLVDKKGRIRGMYSGTDKERVDKLMIDLGRLLNEK